MTIGSLPSATIFEMGYAVPVFSCLKEFRQWKYRDEEFITPADSVLPVEIGGWFAVPLADIQGHAVSWDAVREHCKMPEKTHTWET